MHPHEKIFVALDTTDVEYAVHLATRLRAVVGGVKLGKEFFVACGPEGVRRVTACALPVFLDLKWHDIPNTVAGAVSACLPLRPHIINVHAAGGAAMMRAAIKAAMRAGDARPQVLAVTVLTSLDGDDLQAQGIGTGTQEHVLRLARLAKECGLDGVVCSGHDIERLREALGADFTLLTPGIRPDWAVGNDQKRVLTPALALARGADYLVIGRAITHADDPVDAARRIVAELRA